MSWKTLSTKVVFDNPWITVREDHVINPAGGENHYGHVQFKNLAIGIVPLDEDGHTWIVGQDRYTLGEYSWEIPMGGAPHGEEPLVAARRELKEETGLSASSWRELMRLHVSNSITDEAGIVYAATGLTPGAPDPEDTENITVRRLSFASALEMAMEGEITDAISCAALMRVRLLGLA